ncbi:MAG: tRNA pseudouridine(13) synthase TruD [Thermoplasmata archaeon]
MNAPVWRPPATERELGLEFYLTSTPPVEGILKSTPEDFRVEEISAYPRPTEDGRFVVLRVRSRNWEQHELAQRIAQRLGIPAHQLRWAGTKDRRAVAERLFSYPGALPIADLGLPDVEIVEAYRARDTLVLGHHYGNAFDLRIAPIGKRMESGTVADALQELRAAGGFPNFFGLQRFGEVRPITHEVGRHLVRGDPAAAIESYLVDCPGPEGSAGYAARRAYAFHHDAAQGLREFPAAFRFERQLLDHLARGQPPDRTLRALGRELRMLFVHAYQSFLFNRWVSQRHAEGLSLTVPEEGDYLLRVTRDGTVPGVDPVHVEGDNLEECRAWVGRGRARLAGPLVGSDTPEMTGRGGRLFEGLLTQEGVARAQFTLPRSPELASRGTWRPLWCPLPPIGLAEATTGGGVRLRFALPKGTYATVLLREVLKSGAESTS